MGLIVYVHSISKDPLWSCRAWKLCPKSCLPKIVKYRTLILNHSCGMPDHVFRREQNIKMITAYNVSGRVLELYLFSRRNWNAWQGSLCHASSKYCLYLLQKCSLIFRGIGIQACYISFALLKTGAVTFAIWHLWPAFDISGGFAISPFQIALQLSSQQEMDELWPIL